MSQLISETTSSGRPPSGRAVARRRLRTEEAHALDLAQLRRCGCLHEACKPWVSTWTPSPISTVTSMVAVFLVKDPTNTRALGLGLMDRTAPSEPWGSAGGYAVAFDWTECHLGGRRPWFVCPLVAGGEPCERRVRILYRPLGAPYFGCRGCHGLTYRSRQLHRDRWYEGFERPEKAAQALRRALDPRCSPRRRWRATKRLEAAMPAVERLVASLAS